MDAIVRVAIVDEEADTRLFLADLLQSAPGFKVIGLFSSATGALIGIPRLRPDLALMKVGQPDWNGIECTRQLKRMLPCLKIVIITGRYDENWVKESWLAGADNYLIKPITADQYLATLRFATGCRPEIKPALETPNASIPASLSSERRSLLSPREIEVMNNLANGLLYKEIAEKLGVSFSAVHKHQHNIFRKLRVMNRTEAVAKWHGNAGRFV